MTMDLWDLFLTDAAERLDELEACLTQESCWKAHGLAWASKHLGLLEADAWMVGADGLALAVRTARQAMNRSSQDDEMLGAVLAFVDEFRRVVTELRDSDMDAAQQLLDRLEQAARQVAELGSSQPEQTTETSGREPGEFFVWSPPEDERMVEAFVQECRERLEDLGSKLLDLENAADPQPLLDEIFRDMHTLKGSSAFVRLSPLNELAHAAEDLISTLKKAGLVSHAHVDSLLAVGDTMTSLLELAQDGQPLPASLVDQALDRLARPMTKEMLGSSVQETAPKPAAPSAHRSKGQTIRVDFEKLDSLLNLVGEQVVLKASLRGLESHMEAIVAAMESLAHKTAELGSQSMDPGDLHQSLDAEVRRSRDVTRRFDELLGKMEFSVAKLRDQVMQLRMIPVSRIFSKHRRTVRDLSEALGKSVRLELVGETTELDKILVEKLDEPLVHLVRNALDHGIEPPEERTKAGKDPVATLRLSASHRGSRFVIQVSDDGRGIDPKAVRARALEKGILPQQALDSLDDKRVLDLLFSPGFSTSSKVTDLSGRGVGLDVVAQVTRSLRGSVSISSQPGKGTTFTVTVPLTLAIRQVLLLDVAGRRLAIPLESVSRTTRVAPSQIRPAGKGWVFGTDPPVAVLDLAAVLGLPTRKREERHLVLVDSAGEQFALICDELAGKQEILVKSPEGLLPRLPFVAGATILDNQVVPILDLPAVVGAGLDMEPVASQQAQSSKNRKALVVDDSPSARQVVTDILERLGFHVTEAGDGRQALALAQATAFDLLATDVNMPEMDGYELTRSLRANRETEAMPIVMISVMGEEIDVVRGFDAGVDAYLSKPVQESELARTVQRLLSNEDQKKDD